MQGGNEALKSNEGFDIDALINKLTEKDQSEKTEESEKNEKGENGGDILSFLLKDPELLSKIPKVISTISPLLSSLNKDSTQNKENTEKESKSTQGTKDNSRTSLLYALKPYLSHDRQEAIDYIIKLSKLGEILKSL